MMSAAGQLRVVIVDDERLARNKMRRLLRDDTRVEIVGECDTGEAALECILDTAPDLLFLDIQLPGMSGFDVVAALGPERTPPVVFVTAYDEFALEAFRVHALDYLLKPVDPELVRACVDRTLKHARASTAAGQTQELERLLEHVLQKHKAQPRYLERIMVRARGRMFFIRTTEIDWIEAADNYVRVHIGARAFLVRERIAALEEKLDPTSFVRIHRSTIVNLDSVRELEPWTSGELIVILKDNTRLKLSRNFREQVQKLLDNQPR